MNKIILKLLIQGIRVDLAYSIVVILVITALFSTPLILGSIKNRVYVAVKEQVEKENNAREISIKQADADIQYNLDSDFLDQLRAKYPQHQIVGNLKSVVMIESNYGAEIKTIQTLSVNDPRSHALQIKPTIPKDFGLFDLIVSNQLGESLYGREKWHQLWVNDSFTGEPLKLSINDIILNGKFKIVARQTTPGRKIYASEQLGKALKKYSNGLGAEEVGLPMVVDQVQYALPRFETMHCLLEFPNQECTVEQQDKITKRLTAQNFQLEKLPSTVNQINKYQITLTKFDKSKGTYIATKGDCEKRLYHNLTACKSAILIPKISLPVKLDKEEIQLAAISSASYDLLPGIETMMNEQGGRKIDFWNDGLSEHGIEIIAPYESKLPIGSIDLTVADTKISAFITAYYKCTDAENCPFYTTALMVFRLKNIIDGAAIFKTGNPSIFYPTKKQLKINFDEILFYTNQIEEVKHIHAELEKNLSGYNVQYNIYAIDKLTRQNDRLSTLFHLTLILSIIFIVLAVGALAKINVDKRRRQMAQLFILGYSKSFVSILLVLEYTLLTVLASVTAIGVGSSVFAVARYYLQASLDSTDFTTIVNAMSLDLAAFSNVFLIVIISTALIASFAAYYASKSDPIELLD